MSKSYNVFIPKYEYTIENGAAVKNYASDSLSVTVEADTTQDALLKVIGDIGLNNLQKSGYSLNNVIIEEDFNGSGFIASIVGVKKRK